MRVNSPLLAVLSGALLLAVGACAVDHRSSPGSSSTTVVTPNVAVTSSFRTYESPRGRLYTSTDGRTLYYYNRDQMGLSTCYDNCIQQGQPYMASADARAEGEWSIIARRDGNRQWAHRGRPVYTYYRDQREGDMYGHGNDWVAVGVGIR